MRRWRGNAGAEAMVRLADGRFLVFSEGQRRRRPLSDASLFAGDPAVPGTPCGAAPLPPPAGLPGRPTRPCCPTAGCCSSTGASPGCEGFRRSLVVADPRGLRPGATIEPRREIATLAAPLTVDNMEALSVTRENGRTIVWLASDDNFIPLQRTLLLKFELVE